MIHYDHLDIYDDHTLLRSNLNGFPTTGQGIISVVSLNAICYLTYFLEHSNHYQFKYLLARVESIPLT